MTFQILSLSGGGYLGLYTASVLAKIEESTGTRIVDHFDLLAGTSVGGIIALGLSAGTPASVIRDAFVEHGDMVFSSRAPSQSRVRAFVDFVATITKPRYSSDALRKIVDAVVGTETRIKDLDRATLVTAVNLTKGGPQLFKTAHHADFVRDWSLLVADVALATSAAPTYFPLHEIDGQLFADGGLFANSPDLLAIHEAEHFLGIDLADIRVLSIGTTSSNYSISSAAGTKLGSFGWMRDQRLTSAMIGSQQAVTDHMMMHRLGDRYIRIDRNQSKDQERQLGLDVATISAKRDLQGLAETSVRDHLGRPGLRQMLAHRAPTPVFHHPVKETR